VAVCANKPATLPRANGTANEVFFMTIQYFLLKIPDKQQGRVIHTATLGGMIHHATPEPKWERDYFYSTN